MAPETMTNLGFTEEDAAEKIARKIVYRGRVDKEKDGWLPARDAIEKRGWVKPSIFGSGKWDSMFKWITGGDR